MSEIPEGFQRLPLPEESFTADLGPFYARCEGGHLIVALRVERRHCNLSRTCHGGMLATFCDLQMVIGTNFAADLRRFLPTISLHLDFLAPAPLGAWLEGRTELVTVRGTIVFAQCVITADSVPVVQASGIFRIGGEAEDRFDFRTQFGALARRGS